MTLAALGVAKGFQLPYTVKLWGMGITYPGLGRVPEKVGSGYSRKKKVIHKIPPACLACARCFRYDQFIPPTTALFEGCFHTGFGNYTFIEIELITTNSSWHAHPAVLISVKTTSIATAFRNILITSHRDSKFFNSYSSPSLLASGSHSSALSHR